MRAVIYARYSTENQREASILDQVEVCRRYIANQGWHYADVYDDAAMSGSSQMRPGFQRMMLDAEARRFDVVVCEAIDRLGRKLADVATFYDRLQFAGVKIHALNVGAVTQMHIGIMGTMAQMALTDIRDKVLRGQLGRARAGRIPGGLAYGYAIVPPPPSAKESGERAIIPAEAEIVSRVFREYAAGTSPEVIARKLNAEAVPGPGGRPWINTTIRGQLDRGTGLLNNTLYIGLLSWNRCSYVKDPRTGRRVARVNATGQWELKEVPELRIVDQPLWEAVKARQKQVHVEMPKAGSSGLNATHRRQFLLSGLLTCGCCGGGYTIVGKDRYGCATRRGKGTCDNAQTIIRQRIEARVVGALRTAMLTPERVDTFIRSFADEQAQAQRDTVAKKTRVERRLSSIEQKLQGILRAVENGAWSDTLAGRLRELERDKAIVTAELADCDAPAKVQLHPNAAAIYSAQIAGLEEALNDPAIRAEAGEVLRALIQRVVLTPDQTAADGLAAELEGDLAVILALASRGCEPASRRVGPKREHPGTCIPGCLLSVVAGTRSHLYRTTLQAA